MLTVATIPGHRQTSGNRPRIFVGIATALKIIVQCISMRTPNLIYGRCYRHDCRACIVQTRLSCILHRSTIDTTVIYTTVVYTTVTTVVYTMVDTTVVYMTVVYVTDLTVVPAYYGHDRRVYSTDPL